jgi:hypothetical protein
MGLLSATASRPALVPNQSTTQWTPKGSFPGVKRPGRESDHSPTSSAEVKNEWICTSTHPIRLHCMVLN